MAITPGPAFSQITGPQAQLGHLQPALKLPAPDPHYQAGFGAQSREAQGFQRLAGAQGR